MGEIEGGWRRGHCLPGYETETKFQRIVISIFIPLPLFFKEWTREGHLSGLMDEKASAVSKEKGSSPLRNVSRRGSNKGAADLAPASDKFSVRVPIQFWI